MPGDRPENAPSLHPILSSSSVLYAGYGRIEVLEKAYAMAKSAGIQFPYVGNVPGHNFENTHCPSCGKVLIERRNYEILALRLKDGRCAACGETIPIVMKPSR